MSHPRRRLVHLGLLEAESASLAFRHMYGNPNLRRMTVDGDGFVAQNICDKQFRLSTVDVDGTLTFHTNPI